MLQWIRDHAVECIIWAGAMIRHGLDILPLDAVEKRNKLFFHYENVPVDSGLRLQSALSDQLCVVKPILAKLDDSMELFANLLWQHTPRHVIPATLLWLTPLHVMCLRNHYLIGMSIYIYYTLGNVPIYRTLSNLSHPVKTIAHNRTDSHTAANLVRLLFEKCAKNVRRMFERVR